MHRQGRVLVITGNGKGKTTSALGTAVRASGHGFRVLFLQFIKNKNSRYGEHKFFDNSDSAPFILRPIGLGFKFGDKVYTEEDAKASRQWLDLAQDFVNLSSELKKTMLVLDEVSYPIQYGWIKESEIINFLDKYPELNVILTGRDMPSGIVDYADTVSELKEIKHAYQEGRNAEIGIEF